MQDNTNGNENGKKRPKLYAFPGGGDNGKQPRIKGPVWGSPRLYRCKRCGNTRIFSGVANVKAILTIAATRPFQYDVAEYSLSFDDETDHFVVSCGKCGSFDIETYEVNLSIPALRERVNGEVRRVIPIYNNTIDLMLPDEPDIVFPDDEKAFCVLNSDEARKAVPNAFRITYDEEAELEHNDSDSKEEDGGPKGPADDLPF